MSRLTPLLVICALCAPTGLSAQGTTTAAISGVVRDDRGAALSLADVEVVNHATGFTTRARTRADGRYVVSGLNVGGPYSVAVRHIGFERQARDSIYLTIGQALRLDVELARQAVTLARVTSIASRRSQSAHQAWGVGTLISDSLIHRLPIADRDFYGLVRLVPQISTWYGLSGAGASPRMNAIMIDGTSEQGLYGGNASGAIWGGKAISLEAVKEYQVLLSPFDVRHGNFAGAMINAVTRSGGNEVHGSGFYYGRYGALSRNVPLIRDAYYERVQAGFTLSGPLIRNRANFFIAPEFQRLRFPTVGPYVGQKASATPTLRVHPDTLARFESILAQLGLGGGSSGPVTAGNPLANIFARIDISLPGIHSRLVVRENYGRADSAAFSRPSPPPTPNCRSLVCFPLSSLERRQFVTKDGTVAQLLTTFPGGTYNELIMGRLTTIARISPVLQQPLVLVQVGPSPGQTLQSGAYEVAHADQTDNRSIDVTNNLTIPRGRHSLTLGAATQFFRIRRLDLRGAFGVWTFPSLDALSQRQAQSYRVAQDFGGGDVTVPGAQYSAYASDRWEVNERLTLTYGIRADVPTFRSTPAYSGRVDSLFGRRTDVMPSGRVHWSPRIGFVAEPDEATRVTGGVGVFMGRPPMSWIVNAYGNYGMPRMLTCAAAPARPPVFSTDVTNPPLACLNGQALTLDSVGSVNLVDPQLSFPQNLRTSLSLERRLPASTTLRFEGQFTRAIHELFFVNRNLAEPAGSDANGRVMYGTINANGRSSVSAAKPAFHSDVIELTNQSKDYSYSVTAGLEKRFATNLSANASLTYGRVFDVQSHRFTRSPSFDNWRLGRTVSARQDAMTASTSDFDMPFRAVVSGTHALRHRYGTTDVSVYYLGNSGFPFTYLAGGDQNTGDLNADGTPLNDPIYIPRDATDPSEILFDTTFSVAAQETALESFIQGAPCLQRQRGRIMARNSCRSPWVNTLNIAVRQSIPALRGTTLELQLFNALNLLNRNWGRVQIPSAITAATSQVNLLTHTGQTTSGRSVFRFDPATQRFDAGNVDSYYQIQLGARYSF